MTSLAALIVNYGTAKLTITAVESLLNSDLLGLDMEVHVVDNASPSGDAEMLRKAAAELGWGSRVSLYLEKTNHGFGRGNNLVLRVLENQEKPPKKVFFLNPDACVQPSTVQALSDFLDKHPKAAIAGCRILDPDTKLAVTSAFRFPSLLNEFVGAIQFGPVSRLFSTAQMPMDAELPTMEVDWVSGAAFIARFESIQNVGFFKDDFFLYYEEVDMMFQIRNAGGEIWHVSETCVEHIAGAATGLGGKQNRRRLPAYWYESWRIYTTGNHGRFYSISCAMAKLVGWSLNTLICRLRRKEPSAPKDYFPDFWKTALQPMLFDARTHPK